MFNLVAIERILPKNGCLVLAIIFIGCSSPDPIMQKSNNNKNNVTKTQITISDPIVVESKSNTIGPWNIKSIGNKVVKIIAQPSEITLNVGEELDLNLIKVFAFDQNNNNLGEVWGYDVKIDSGLLKYVDKKPVANIPGIFSVKLTFPTYGMIQLPENRPNVYLNVKIFEN